MELRNRAVGTESPKVLEKLKSIILEKYSNLTLDNEHESDKKCNTFLTNEYSTIEQKLRNNEYKTFVDFGREIKKLQRFFKERGPEGPFREYIEVVILLDYESEFWFSERALWKKDEESTGYHLVVKGKYY